MKKENAPSEISPSWIHRTTILDIGGKEFTFRTMSLYDVWQVWPHVKPMMEAIGDGLKDGEPIRPLSADFHAKEMLKVLCPALAYSDAAMKGFKPVHFNALKEFYEEHDWGRIVALGQNAESASGEEAEGPQDLTASQRFLILCKAAASFVDMSVIDFVEQRFEFCADALMALHSSLREEARAKEQKPAEFFSNLPSMSIVKGDSEKMTYVIPGRSLEEQERKGGN
jgi:hypothetical protein